MAVAIRTIADRDLEGADLVLRAAFGAPTSVARLQRYRHLEPDGWFLAEESGRIVGTVGTIGYGAFAYIGLMAVHPEAQRRGVGRALLEHALGWLDGRGVGCAVLDATEYGVPLYRSLGFVETGTSHDLQATRPVIGLGAGVELVTDREEIAALDRALFGADRGRLWRRLWDESPGGMTVVRDAGGAAIGYACARRWGLGPWGARTLEAAQALLAAHADLPIGVLRALVPGENEAGRAMLARYGFVQRRVVRHMRRGALDRAPRWSQVYGKASFCLG
jgi:GNAT superfamily N-acetyltransferase